MQESKNVKNTEEKEQEKDSNSQKDNFYKYNNNDLFKIKEVVMFKKNIHPF